jgi:hypothetical protein
MSIGEGDCEFALLERNGIIFLLYRFGQAVAWSDCPYQWHLEPPDTRTTPREEPTSETRTLAQVVLIDAANGIVLGLRAVSWSPAFTAAVNRAIWHQAVGAWAGQADFHHRLQAIWATMTSNQMVDASSCRCKGGA